MQTLTCPIPNNINPLQSNGFMFTILKLPEIQFFCQEANLPGLDLPPATQYTSIVDGPHPGDKLLFGDLNITFLIDENMTNWKALYDWMVGLGFPESHEQFSKFITSRTNPVNPNVSIASVSDAVLQILNSANKPVSTIQFRDLFPTALSSIQMQSTTQDTMYLAGQATFKYTLYQFV
jgi:hypothetical protein